MPRRILIVDDEPEPLRAAARVLRRAGYEVSTAEDGQGALVGMSRGRFDAVVSDISMPGMDGIALLQNIRDEVFSYDKSMDPSFCFQPPGRISS